MDSDDYRSPTATHVGPRARNLTRLSGCGKLHPHASLLPLALRRDVLQGVRLGNGGDNLRRRALFRDLARMLPQFRKRHAANSVRNQNSESQRRQRRTYQHQHIHCILHIPNTLLGLAEGPSPFRLDAPTRRSDTLSFHLIPNRSATH